MVEGLQPGLNQFIWSVFTENCFVTDTVTVEYTFQPIAEDDEFVVLEDKDLGKIDPLANDDLTDIREEGFSLALLDIPPDLAIEIDSNNVLVARRPEGQEQDLDFEFSYQLCNITENCVLCDTATVKLTILYNPEIALLVKDAFRPAGINPSWGITVNRALGEGTIYISDRWGRILKEYDIEPSPKGREIRDIWDGTNNSGQRMPAGAYYFWFNGTAADGPSVRQDGIIYLVD